jgi:hypothetical protein
VARYHMNAGQPSHWPAALEIELRHWHGLPARCSDTIGNESDERALGHRPNKSRPVTGRRDLTRVAHTPTTRRTRNFSASLATATIGAAPHGDKRPNNGGGMRSPNGNAGGNGTIRTTRLAGEDGTHETARPPKFAPLQLLHRA